ncbi:hypothetical protein FKP32DRAFT_868669 [Trametes sanguinea]|nr:hypothetical protein FKP32DRAFT_868669 [Trametes sanguinea]
MPFSPPRHRTLRPCLSPPLAVFPDTPSPLLPETWLRYPPTGRQRAFTATSPVVPLLHAARGTPFLAAPLLLCLISSLGARRRGTADPVACFPASEPPAPISRGSCRAGRQACDCLAPSGTVICRFGLARSTGHGTCLQRRAL